MTLKHCKLTFHQKSQQSQQKAYASEDLALCSKEFPTLKENDIVEIATTDDSSSSFLLKVTKGSLRDDFTPKDTISIDQAIGTAFQLKPYIDVTLTKVDAVCVELDSVELTFKDQYLGRSEMWRLKNSLTNSCVYHKKKIEFCSSTIRCQVHELWSGGLVVTSGLVTEATKIVFRSLTSMVYLFIQMSSEMWEFDICGDLYFEKAVNGFLSKLFKKWKSNGSNHEVTIVLFSRLYYEASSLERFPEAMRECLLTDYKGRFYEDFYRVVVQNEKYEDWRNTLISLRQVFVDYREYLLNFHQRKFPNIKVPKAYVSSAAQGNFLEVLNMSLNVFEKHFVDRSFDRTGQLSVVITPGVGVFEVDRDLTNVTMQRIIDNGVGSDLVCVGEQPLHAVPLLKFHNKATHHDVDDYSMPHWINLSFYSSNKQVGYATFVPRIKLPSLSDSSRETISVFSPQWRNPLASIHLGDESGWPNSVYDFDSYDDSIFKPSSSQLASKQRRIKHMKRPKTLVDSDFSRIFMRQNSEPEIHATTSTDMYSSTTSIATGSSSLILSSSTQPSSAITIPSKIRFRKSDNVYSSSFGALNIEPGSFSSVKPRVALTPINDRWIKEGTASGATKERHEGSSPSMSSHGGSPKELDFKGRFGNLRRPSRSLINPFDPSHAVIKLTSNRRRWTHIFPRGPSGTFIQQHHFSTGLNKLDIVPEGEATTAIGNTMNDGTHSLSRQSIKDSPDGSTRTKKVTRLWGATGEQEWTPALTTGVDWKSLTIPACLPLTTDYFPDERSLKTDYLVSDYSLLPDDVNADYISQRAIYRRPLTTKEVFFELVSQRLAQGFQTVIRPKHEKPPIKQQSSFLRLNILGIDDETEEYFLSIGRIFHQISLSSSTITVTRYRPRHPYPAIKVYYKYRFYAPNNNNFEVSYADFSTEKLENYNWNYLDHYICTRGDTDFALTENLKYWRFRMFILPINQVVLKRLMGEGVSPECNIYEPLKLEEKRSHIQEFLKFIETCINRIRRPNTSIPKGPRGASGGSVSSMGSGSFRERVNSNQLPDRPRIRSGSKLAEKQRHESASGRISPLDSPLDSKIFSLSGNLGEPFPDLTPLTFPPRTENTTEGELVPIMCLKADATFKDIVIAMRNQATGLSFIKVTGLELHPWTFVSYDAIMWLINRMEGVSTDSKAMEIFDGMLNERFIIHASGDSSHKFKNGFYIYYISNSDIEGMEPLIPHHDNGMLHNEWMEVDVPCECELNIDSVTKNSLLNFDCSSGNHKWKDVYVDVDTSRKSDRQEWGHIRYQSLFKPDEAFEITVQWIQATGSIITDLVQAWSRKAQQCNLQLVPVPTDPFALPNYSSDPLRGPIKLTIDSLTEGDAGDSSLTPSEVMYFQHTVALKFGFVRCAPHAPAALFHALKPNDLHYVHSSGNMFLIVPICQSVADVCFLWSWNYLVSKRWRISSNPALGDDTFMFKVLHDFKSFCANENNRLTNFWNSTVMNPQSPDVDETLLDSSLTSVPASETL
ncbi:GATOR complex protein Iml1 isoform X3 [Folsomia candida]|uniref:GATOR complex protein Iml1 isoform X3 n=1 Tax=Folsomia candida TaxID=158441 RepID=UPI000B90629E|nr:GATOR complex protein Iml1 isoform X3 [Folsomia candida]